MQDDIVTCGFKIYYYNACTLFSIFFFRYRKKIEMAKKIFIFLMFLGDHPE